MGATRPRFEITNLYYVEALSRLRAGTPVSGTLREARAIIAERGWMASSGDEYDLHSRGPIDVDTAVQLAAGVEPGPVRLMDGFAWFTPIESIVRSPVAKWERESDLRTADVLAAMDEAVEFALEAERSPAGLIEAVSKPSS